MKSEIAKLKYWLSLQGNSETKLAAILGYKSSMAITQWLVRGKIPDFRIDDVMEIIDDDIAAKSPAREDKKAASTVDLRRRRSREINIRG